MPPTVIVADQDPTSAGTMAAALVDAGFCADRAASGPDVLPLLASAQPGLVILDLLLPGLSGLDVCRLIREHSNVPIIIVSERDSELEAAVTLEVGADAYVIKPVNPAEIVARVRGLLRRAGDQERRREPPTIVTVGDVRLDAAAHSVTVGERRVSLSLKEFAILRLLLERAGKTVPRNALVSEVWGLEQKDRQDTLDAHMRRLRAKIEGKGAADSRITTLRRIGYRYEKVTPV